MEYIKLASELYVNGLDVQAIQNTCCKLIDPKSTKIFLRREAYQPTGLAFGCSLPESSQTELFYRLACLADAQLKQCINSDQPTLAYVPADWYHITIANRTHYKFSSISCLNEYEKQAVETLISKLALHEIRVISTGLILTTSGGLFVKCLPIDDRLLHLRTALARALPELWTNIPKMVHIKLGHLMTPLATPQLQSFMAWLTMTEQHAIYDLVFTDVYTPKGRISL
jgi:hypothetical protein